MHSTRSRRAAHTLGAIVAKAKAALRGRSYPRRGGGNGSSEVGAVGVRQDLMGAHGSEGGERGQVGNTRCRTWPMERPPDDTSRRRKDRLRARMLPRTSLGESVALTPTCCRRRLAAALDRRARPVITSSTSAMALLDSEPQGCTFMRHPRQQGGECACATQAYVSPLSTGTRLLEGNTGVDDPSPSRCATNRVLERPDMVLCPPACSDAA